jgi:aminomethyltransferase
MTLAQQTPLFELHQKQGAKIVDFHHWLMPLHYGSAIAEHQAVRKSAGVFDVSHMTIIDCIGAGARPFLRYIMTKDVDDIQHLGGACYSLMCNEQGGVIDDVMVYYRHPDNYRLIFNSSTKERVIEWLHLKSQGFQVGLQVRHDLCILAIQGPEAFAKLCQVVDNYQMDGISTLARFNALESQGIFFGRTGYTGEDGFECIMSAELALNIWEKLMSVGVPPCGLACRDSLRLEAGLMLNGQDMNEQISPLQVGLNWAISWKDEERSFIGKAALLRERDEGVSHVLIGIKLYQKAILRHDQDILLENGSIVGKITSGIFSPSLGQSIGFARIKSNVKDKPLFVDIRGKVFPLEIHSTRFYKSQKITTY